MYNVSQELLKTYSKYCRLFLSDTEMREEYKEAVEKHGSIPLPWTNSFEFEKSQENFIIKIQPESDQKEEKNLLYFDEATASHQVFTFCSTIMDYVGRNANAKVLRKLNFSCKYFYAVYETPVCYRVIIQKGVTNKVGSTSLLIASSFITFTLLGAPIPSG